MRIKRKEQIMQISSSFPNMLHQESSSPILMKNFTKNVPPQAMPPSPTPSLMGGTLWGWDPWAGKAVWQAQNQPSQVVDIPCHIAQAWLQVPLPAHIPLWGWVALWDPQGLPPSSSSHSGSLNMPSAGVVLHLHAHAETYSEAKHPGALPPTADALCWDAPQGLTLRCGRSAIILGPNGHVALRGDTIHSQAWGVHRIQGGVVRIN